MRRRMWGRVCMIICLSSAVFCTGLCEQPETPGFVQSLHSELDDPGREYAIEARWWLAEGTHSDKTIIDGIEALSDAGYGAIEFVTLNEEGVDHQRYAWGSEEWAHDSALMIREATKRGMGVSFTSGTNWGTANLPNITPDDEEASQEIDFTSERVASGKTRGGALKLCESVEKNVFGRKPNLNFNKQRLIHIAAFRVDPDPDPAAAVAPDLSHIPDEAIERIMSSRMLAPNPPEVTYLDISSGRDLTALARQDETGTWALDWTAPDDGEYELITFWMHGTGHHSEPSVGTNVTIDYISGKGADALIVYWMANLLDEELIETIRENGRVQLYMDSLELETYGNGGHYWCRAFIDEFEKRRGYDLRPYLPFILRASERTIDYWYQAAGQEALLKKVRTDLYQTLTEMYSENTLGKLRTWLHSIGMTLRAENSYCQTFEITYPMQYLDSVETESLEFMDQIDSFRAMSGGAHVYNKVLSSESGAQYALYSTNFDRLLNMMYTQFSSGISRTVVHGFSVPEGPKSNYEWPGHQYSFALFSQRAPYWRDSVDVNTQIARLQKILRDGKSRMDVGILRYDYQLFSFHDNAFWDAMKNHYGFNWADLTLQDAGYTYDYFSPEVLEHEQYTFLNEDNTFGHAGYQTLVLFQEQLACESAKALYKLARKGLPVVIVDGETVEYDWGRRFFVHEGAAKHTPFNDGLDDKLAATIKKLKKLDSVRVVDTEQAVYEALIELGVRPRVEFADSNQKLLTVTRDWDSARFVYIHNYKFDEPDAYSGDIIVDGAYTPYLYDPWTGEMTGIGEYEIDSLGRTILNVSLEPGEIAVLALDPEVDATVHAVAATADSVFADHGNLIARVSGSGSYTTRLSDGTTMTTDIKAPEDIDLGQWNLKVESWKSGDLMTHTEDRGAGYTTTEYEQVTATESIRVGTTPLVSWSDMKTVGDKVSGVGTYTTTFMLPDDWRENNTAVFAVDSLGGGTARVYVNGIKADPVDITNVAVDITGLVHPGENTIKVEIATGLTNVLQGLGKRTTSFGGIWKGPYDYGMIGEAKILTYTDVTL